MGLSQNGDPLLKKGGGGRKLFLAARPEHVLLYKMVAHEHSLCLKNIKQLYWNLKVIVKSENRNYK